MSDDTAKIAEIEEAFYQAALKDWRAALAWLKAHPETADRYANVDGAATPKEHRVTFRWETDS